MRKLLSVLLLCAMSSFAVAADENGLISKPSTHSVKVTLDRLEALLKKKGITVVARWSHDAGAKKVDMKLRPTELLIFGNPKLGTPLMQSDQRMGIELPMKALAWEDKKGQVWLSYNDPAHMSGRFGVKDCPAVIKKMSGALGKLTSKAAAKE